MFSGSVTLANTIGTDSYGWTIVSSNPNKQTELFYSVGTIAIGSWVELNSSMQATTTFAAGQKSIGVVSSIFVDGYDNQIADGPILVQTVGYAFVKCTGNTINANDLLIPDTNGKVKATTFNPLSPTPIIGCALEASNNTIANMVKMKIQICGD